MTDRRRNGLVLILVLGLLAAAIAVIGTKDTRLGLDLKGGVELVYEAQPTAAQPTVTLEALDNAVDIMRDRVDALGVSEPEIQRSTSSQISVQLPGVGNIERAKAQVGTPAQLAFYDFEAKLLGADNRPIADDLAGGDPQAQRTSQLAGDPAGGLPLRAAVVQAAKRDAVQDGDNFRLGSQFWAFGKDTAYLAGPEANREDLSAEKPLPPGAEILEIKPGTVILQAIQPEKAPEIPLDQPERAKWYVFEDDPALLGKDLKNPEQGYDQGPAGSGGPNVAFQFTDLGKRQFKDITRTIAQRGLELPRSSGEDPLQHFAIALDRQLISVATIDFTKYPEGIDGETGAQISGNFDIREAQDLASQLRTGALPVGLKLISESRVSATLGQQALDQGLTAAVAGLVIVAAFLLLFYRVLGLIAAAALVVYAIYFLALVKLIPITLTLPGIAGLILTLGVAADANIVIFERVKEEVRAGRSTPQAIAQGFRKGLSAIIDANVVTLMTAFILFILATAGVRGFALTLGIGTLVLLFTAVVATQAALGTMSRTKLIRRPSALGAPRRRRELWRPDFMGAARWFFSVSGVILLIGALAIGSQGLNLGIDFESGTRIQTALERPTDEDGVRAVFAQRGFEQVEIQRFENKDFGDNAFQIQTGELQPEDVDGVKAALDDRFGVPQNDAGGDQFDSQTVGPTFGQTVANSAIVAIIASLLVISAYIALRFEWKYAVPVLIALAHDLLITAGVYSLTDREVTTATVAALLTILGYSLYDTIIVFDRVRENVPRMPSAAFSQIVNRSMSEVLVRSLATSFCTLLPVLALLLFGGATLQDFAFALLVGVASGAYSSVFIAGPVLTLWKEHEQTWRRRRQAVEKRHDGIVPAYATAASGAPIDVDPDQGPIERRDRLTAPDPESVSAAEFEQMRRELDVDEARPAVRTGRRARRAAGVADPPPLRPLDEGKRPGGNGDSSDEAPGADAAAKQRKPRNRKHGRPR